MSEFPICPNCKGEYAYSNGELMVCPDCNHEWTPGDESEAMEGGLIVKDAHGNILQDGDTVMVIKNLPVKGSAKPIKSGTKVKNIRIVEGDHNIDCKIDGYGAMSLKSEFVKKV